MEKSKKSIRYSILIRFLFVLAIVFALMWILQVLLYDKIYEAIKTSDAKKINSEISKYYEKNDFDSLFELSMANDYSIVIFTFESDSSGTVSTKIVFSTLRTGDDKAIGRSLSTMLERLSDNVSVEFLEDKGGYQALTYGEKKQYNNDVLYIYSSAIVTPTDSTTEVIVFMLMIITIVGLFVAIAMSALFANSLSKPLTNMSTNAKKLSKGDMNISFDGGKYEELSELASILNLSVSEIKKSQDIQREVVQNVSHELRTPLTMIKSYTELIEDYSGDDPKKRKEHLDIILQESNRLETLVNDMLDLSKLQARTMQYNISTFDMVESIKKFEVYYKKEFSPKGFDFTFTYPESYIITADKVRIEQVITNLINNAINYSRDNKSIIVILGENEEGQMALQVIDHGVGISVEDQKRIFDRHFRSVSTKRAVIGSGVGLTIVKEILEHHNYKYGVKSKLNEGSEFFVIFC